MKTLYSAFGLTIASQLPLPELSPGRGRPDVHIAEGVVPAELSPGARSSPYCEVEADRCLLRLEGAAGARFLIRGGRLILFQRSSRESAPGLLRSFLLGSCMGAVLYQRGALVLHGSAVACRGSALLFCGESGQGKSTLAAAFTLRGYHLLADDLCAVSVPAARPALLHPGYPRLRLWPDSLAALQLREPGLPPRQPQKTTVPASHGRLAQPAPVGAIFVFAEPQSSRPEVRAVSGTERLTVLWPHLYRLVQARPLLRPRALFESLSAVAHQVRVYRLALPHDFTLLPEVVERIQELLRGPDRS